MVKIPKIRNPKLESRNKEKIRIRKLSEHSCSGKALLPDFR